MKKTLQLASVAILTVAILTSASINGYKVGDTVKDFKLKNIDGKMISLSEFSDAKGFIVIFTCNHCPYAKAYEERVMALDNKYKSKGFPIIAINPNDPVAVPDDSFENMVQSARKKGFTFPYLMDETQQVARQFGAARTPHVYVLNKTASGNEVAYVGAIDDNTEDASQVKHTYVEDAVNALLNGKDISVTETKAVGCTIKWKK
jgi:peroxiredoxin